MLWRTWGRCGLLRVHMVEHSAGLARPQTEGIALGLSYWLQAPAWVRAGDVCHRDLPVGHLQQHKSCLSLRLARRNCVRHMKS